MNVIEHKDAQMVAYEQSCRDAEWSRRCLFALFAYVGLPKQLLDAGCGSGHLVKTAASLGVTSTGIDINAEQQDGSPRYFVMQGDITDPDIRGVLSNFVYADLVLCLETAEHVPASKADALCDNLAYFTADNGLLIFSAARPGQGGSGHLNEQPRKYWRDKLMARGFVPDRLLTRQLSNVWTQVGGHCHWYGENVQVLRRAAQDD